MAGCIFFRERTHYFSAHSIEWHSISNPGLADSLIHSLWANHDLRADCPGDCKAAWPFPYVRPGRRRRGGTQPHFHHRSLSQSVGRRWQPHRLCRRYRAKNRPIAFRRYIPQRIRKSLTSGFFLSLFISQIPFQNQRRRNRVYRILTLFPMVVVLGENIMGLNRGTALIPHSHRKVRCFL